MFRVNYKETRITSGAFIVKFKHILQFFLVFLLLAFNVNFYWDGRNLGANVAIIEKRDIQLLL